MICNTDLALLKSLLDRDVLLAHPDRTVDGEWKIRFAIDIGDDIVDAGDLDWSGPGYKAAIELARTFRNLEWNERAVKTVVDVALDG